MLAAVFAGITSIIAKVGMKKRSDERFFIKGENY